MLRLAFPLLLAAAMCFPLRLLAQAPPSERLVAILSDLHLGEEDRDTLSAAFAALLSELTERSPDGVDLILNGDTLELGELALCDRGCGEAEALSALERLFTAQAWFADALRDFSLGGAHRVVFVPGDEDAALLFPMVADRLSERTKAEVAADGLWVSRDGRVVVEHGHQLPGDPYRYERWPQPFAQGDRRLRLSQGQLELRSMERRLQAKYPVLAHFATRLSGLKYGVAAIGEEPPVELLKLFLLGVSFQQFRQDLEQDVQAPEWDLASVKSMDGFLLESIPEDDPLYDEWEQTSEAGRLSLRMLGEEDIRRVCDYRAAVRRARRRMERGLSQLARVGPVVAECPRTEQTRGMSFSYFWRSRDKRYGEHLEVIEDRLGRSPDVYVHGHSHVPGRGFVPMDGQARPRIFDSGAFMRRLTPASLEALRQAGDVGIGGLLESLKIDELSSCYSFVLVEPSENGEASPNTRLWYLNGNDDGNWDMSTRCEA